MAGYKVPADVSGDDNLFGGLSFKQFVFGLIAAAIIALGYFVGSSTSFFAMIPFIIPAIPFIFLAAPLGRDQPNDVWLAARLRFYLKPRVRVWDQGGLADFVTINVPKREAHIYTDGLSRNEVNSRLDRLAQTIDSRGWASKNSSVTVANPDHTLSNDERLIATNNAPQQVPDTDIKPWDDIFDGEVSQHMDQIISARSTAARTRAVESMAEAKQEQVKMMSEQELLDRVHEREKSQHMARSHEKIVVPVGQEDKFYHEEPEQPEPVKKAPQKQLDADIIKRIAEEGPDLKVSTLAGLAQHAQNQTSGEIKDEGEIDLH